MAAQRVMHPRAGTSAHSLKNEQKLMTTKNLNLIHILLIKYIQN